MSIRYIRDLTKAQLAIMEAERMSIRYIRDLTKAQLAIMEAEDKTEEALTYSCVPGATKEEIGQDAVAVEVITRLRAAREILHGFTTVVDARGHEYRARQEGE